MDLAKGGRDKTKINLVKPVCCKDDGEMKKVWEEFNNTN